MSPRAASPRWQPIERVKPTVRSPTNGALRQGCGTQRGRGGDRNGTLMRHAHPWLTLSIRSLTMAMCLPTCRCRLVTAARSRHLLLPHPLPARVAAIALSTVTTATDGEDRAAIRIETPARAKTFRASIRCQCFRHSPHNTQSADDRTDDSRLPAPMMSLSSLRLMFRKLRFQMIDYRRLAGRRIHNPSRGGNRPPSSRRHLAEDHGGRECAGVDTRRPASLPIRGAKFW
jgi:hypothetical protein